MQAYMGFLEAEPGKHPVIIKSWIGISWPVEIIGAFSGTWGSRLYRGPDLYQTAVCLFWTFCDVFVYFNRLAFRHGCVSPVVCFWIAIDIVIPSRVIRNTIASYVVDL